MKIVSFPQLVPVQAVTCVDGQPQSMAAAQILSRMLKHGDEVWVACS